MLIASRFMKEKLWTLLRESFFFAVCLTFAFIFFIIHMGGVERLNPRNFQWISGDNSLSYISQLYFLSDSWRFPLGINPNYGLEVSTSLTYTGPPLPMMLLQKILGVAPELQFFGLWLLLCLHLQIFIGFKLARLLGGDVMSSLIFGLLQVTPFLLMRMQIHYWLAGHFLILFSLYILVTYFKTNRVLYLSTFCVLFISYTVHSYLLLFSLIIFFAICIDDFVRSKRKLRFHLKKYLGLLVLTPVISYFLLDALSSGSGSILEKVRMNFTGQYSFYPSNLLAPFNPEVGFARDCSEYHCMFGNSIPNNIVSNFSVFSIDLGGVQGNEDGYLYLGAGVFFMVLAVVSYLVRKSVLTKRLIETLSGFKHLIVYLSFVYLFSITNRVTIGSLELHLEIPKILRWALSVFRGTGRFGWIIAYVIVAFVFFLAVTIFKPNTLRVVMLLSLIIQIFDFSKPLYTHYSNASNEIVRSFAYSPELDRTFRDLSKGKQIMRAFPSSSMQGFPALSYLAWRNGLSTNLAQSARFNYAESRRIDTNLLSQLCSRSVDKNVIVVIPSNAVSALAGCPTVLIPDRVVDNFNFYSNR